MRHKEGNQLQSDYRHLSLVKVTSLFLSLFKTKQIIYLFLQYLLPTRKEHAK